MPTILYPDVPIYPGVPQLLRAENAGIASSPVLSIGIGTAENVLLSSLQQVPKWGIFDEFGNQLGIDQNTTTSVLSAVSGALLSQLTGALTPILSTFGVDYTRECKISSYPVEQGSFASYNKVQMPATPTVTLMLQGSLNDRTAFLEAIDSACISTDLYSVVTPEYIYANYNLVRYNYARRAQQGVTLLIVEVALEEVRQINSTLSTAAVTPLVLPQDPNATSQVNNGITQPAAVPQSTLLGLYNNMSSYWSKFFSGGN